MMLGGKTPNHPYNVKKLEASNGPNQGTRRSRRKRDGKLSMRMFLFVFRPTPLESDDKCRTIGACTTESTG
jgi:hypothetical protein